MDCGWIYNSNDNNMCCLLDSYADGFELSIGDVIRYDEVMDTKNPRYWYGRNIVKCKEVGMDYAWIIDNKPIKYSDAKRSRHVQINHISNQMEVHINTTKKNETILYGINKHGRIDGIYMDDNDFCYLKKKFNTAIGIRSSVFNINGDIKRYRVSDKDGITYPNVYVIRITLKVDYSDFKSESKDGSVNSGSNSNNKASVLDMNKQQYYPQNRHGYNNDNNNGINRDDVRGGRGNDVYWQYPNPQNIYGCGNNNDNNNRVNMVNQNTILKDPSKYKVKSILNSLFMCICTLVNVK